MEMETMDLKTLDSEQLEVYNYLVDTVGYDEDYAYGIVSEYEYRLYDDFEEYVDDRLFQVDCELPVWINIDYLGTFKSMCMYSDCRNFYFKNNPDFSSRDLYEKEGLKEFENLFKFSKFVEIWGLEC